MSARDGNGAKGPVPAPPAAPPAATATVTLETEAYGESESAPSRVGAAVAAKLVPTAYDDDTGDAGDADDKDDTDIKALEAIPV